MVVMWCGWATMGGSVCFGFGFRRGCVDGSGLVVLSRGLGDGVETQVVSVCSGFDFFCCSVFFLGGILDFSELSFVFCCCKSHAMERRGMVCPQNARGYGDGFMYGREWGRRRWEGEVDGFFFSKRSLTNHTPHPPTPISPLPPFFCSSLFVFVEGNKRKQRIGWG